MIAETSNDEPGPKSLGGYYRLERDMQENPRVADYPIEPSFLERWSPRAFAAAVEISEVELFTMFEAARWAPSCLNAQPWRFVYARRGTPPWDRHLGLLRPSNHEWAKNASALVFFVSKKTLRLPSAETESPSYTHSLDTGAATALFALQAQKLGWAVHGMAGFDVERSYAELDVRDGFRVEAVFAVGRRASRDELPEHLRSKESPSGRIPVADLAFEGAMEP